MRAVLVLVLGLGIASAATNLGCSSDDGSDEGTSADELREVISGPAVKTTDAQVWTVENQWADKSTPNATKAGVAWPANSGLTWEEKYAKWIGSFERVPDRRGWGDTIRIPTPYGNRKLEGPVLECADVAIWLRLTFASIHHLPFYLSGRQNNRPFYAGHFGFVDANGQPLAGYPRFTARYTDHEKRWRDGDPWPNDPELRKKHVGNDDGANGVHAADRTLDESDGAGAYLDELFLNKRAGHLMVLLDGMFGSVNLADGANMFHVKPDAILAGDVLVERWGSEGIGHTLPVMTVAWPAPNRLEVSLASGSMPRRQPAWGRSDWSIYYFTASATGGPGYETLGGGLRRWRTPVASGGRWTNVVPVTSRSNYISDDRIADIGARPARFEELLRPPSPEERRDSALQKIESARRELRQKPASCARRTEREGAFEALYSAMADLGSSRSDVDAQYRKLEDFVFAELSYVESKTCCWNSTDAAMADIVLDFATKEKAENDAAGACKQPTPFKATAGGYETWRAHAESLGRAAAWRQWSEDEPCAQRGVTDDGLSATGNVAMCEAPADTSQ